MSNLAGEKEPIELQLKRAMEIIEEAKTWIEAKSALHPDEMKHSDDLLEILGQPVLDYKINVEESNAN